VEVVVLESATATPSRDTLNAGKDLPERTHHTGAGERPTRDNDQAMKQQSKQTGKRKPRQRRGLSASYRA